VYGHLHGSHVFPKGIKGKYDNIEYKLVSLDYLNAKPMLVYDSEGGFNYESNFNSTR
jgi:predicted phosphohydrolase